MFIFNIVSKDIYRICYKLTSCVSLIKVYSHFHRKPVVAHWYFYAAISQLQQRVC